MVVGRELGAPEPDARQGRVPEEERIELGFCPSSLSLHLAAELPSHARCGRSVWGIWWMVAAWVWTRANLGGPVVGRGVGWAFGLCVLLVILSVWRRTVEKINFPFKIILILYYVPSILE